jgi:hypothetical protein
MNPVVSAHIDEIARACRAHGAVRLEVFGSAASASFDPDHSDVDFLVEFDGTSESDLFGHYFGLKQALEAIVRRPVDLVMAGAMRNPYFIEAVDSSRRLVYAAPDAEAA